MNDEDRPLCKCHGEPMYTKGKPRSGVQYWKCAVKSRERSREWRRCNPEKIRNYRENHPEQQLAKNRRWRANNPDKVRELNARRIFAAGMYLGSFGFTDREREKLLEVANGKAD